MVKSKNLPDKHSGYNSWSIKRTIREASNIARWSPWHSHAWMEEARDSLSLDYPFYSEYNAAAREINLYWLRLNNYRWYNESEFWAIDGEPQPVKLIEYI
jgi:hypothetical protein